MTFNDFQNLHCSLFRIFSNVFTLILELYIFIALLVHVSFFYMLEGSGKNFGHESVASLATSAGAINNMSSLRSSSGAHCASEDEAMPEWIGHPKNFRCKF
jgi:hypothetical protein